MERSNKRILSLFLILVVLLSSLPFSASASGVRFAAETAVSASDSEDTSDSDYISVNEDEMIISGGDIISESSVSAADIGKVAATVALLVDVDSGRILYEQDAHKQRPPASTTKIMTALLVLEAVERGEISLDKKIKVKRNLAEGVMYDASHVSPRIKWNEILTLEQLLYCVMIESDCACCEIVGAEVAGSVEKFVELMNERAQEIGCKDTVFVNAHGYPAKGHTSTAWDLYLIAREAMKNETFRKIVSTRVYTVPKTNLVSHKRTLYNSNWLLGMPPKSQLKVKYDQNYKYDNCIGVKTGYSSEAGTCLVSYAEKNGRTLCCVVMGTWGVKLKNGTTRRQSFTESKRLFEWGFDNFYYQTFLSGKTRFDDIPLPGGVSGVSLVPVSDTSVLVRNDEHLNISASLDSGVCAPVSAGDVIGTLDISYENGEPAASVRLYAAGDVAAIPPDIPEPQNGIAAIFKGHETLLLGGNLAFMAVAIVILFAKRAKRIK